MFALLNFLPTTLLYLFLFHTDMIDISLVRADTAGVKANIAKRNNPAYNAQLQELIAVDADWRTLKTKIDSLRQKRNTISLRINEAKKAGKEIQTITREAKELPQQVATAEEALKKVEQRMRVLLCKVPNLIHDSVPFGTDAAQNKVVKEFGKIKKPKFALKSHVDLALANDWIDIDRASKITGSRWYFLKGDLAILEMALARFGVDFMRKKGFQFVVPPHMMNKAAYEGVTDFSAFEDMLYKIENDDLYTIATSEHPLTAQFMNEILEEKQLPIKIAGYSTNFRKEAGAHGKDQKGIFRVHQFNKVEQIIISKPEDSWKMHEELAANAAEFWKKLDVPFHQIVLCSGDTGAVSAKTYDFEAWYPVQQAYREVGSCSNVTEYQSRGLNIRYGAERKFCHTLNSTLVATSRALVALLENHQQPDGSVNIPKALHKYTGFKLMKAKKDTQ